MAARCARLSSTTNERTAAVGDAFVRAATVALGAARQTQAGSGRRQDDGEARASRLRSKRHRAAVTLDDFLHHRQAKAGAVGLGGEEEREDLLADRRRNARAVVLHVHHACTRGPDAVRVGHGFEHQSQLATRRSCIHGVLNQILEGVAHLPPIELQARQVRRRLDRHLDVFVAQPLPREQQGIVQHLAHVALGQLELRVAGVLTQFFDLLGQARDLFHHVVDGAAPGAPGLGFVAHVLDVEAQAAERIADLVAQLGGDLAHGSQPRAPLVLGGESYLFGDVAEGEHVHAPAALRLGQMQRIRHADGEIENEILALARRIHDRGPMRHQATTRAFVGLRLRRHRAVQELERVGTRREQLVQRATFEVLAVATQKRRRARIRLQHAPAGVGGHEAAGHQVQCHVVEAPQLAHFVEQGAVAPRVSPQREGYDRRLQRHHRAHEIEPHATEHERRLLGHEVERHQAETGQHRAPGRQSEQQPRRRAQEQCVHEQLHCDRRRSHEVPRENGLDGIGDDVHLGGAARDRRRPRVGETARRRTDEHRARRHRRFDRGRERGRVLRPAAEIHQHLAVRIHRNALHHAPAGIAQDEIATALEAYCPRGHAQRRAREAQREGRSLAVQQAHPARDAVIVHDHRGRFVRPRHHDAIRAGLERRDQIAPRGRLQHTGAVDECRRDIETERSRAGEQGPHGLGARRGQTGASTARSQRGFIDGNEVEGAGGRWREVQHLAGLEAEVPRLVLEDAQRAERHQRDQGHRARDHQAAHRCAPIGHGIVPHAHGPATSQEAGRTHSGQTRYRTIVASPLGRASRPHTQQVYQTVSQAAGACRRLRTLATTTSRRAPGRRRIQGRIAFRFETRRERNDTRTAAAPNRLDLGRTRRERIEHAGISEKSALSHPSSERRTQSDAVANALGTSHAMGIIVRGRRRPRADGSKSKARDTSDPTAHEVQRRPPPPTARASQPIRGPETESPPLCAPLPRPPGTDSEACGGKVAGESCGPGAPTARKTGSTSRSPRRAPGPPGAFFVPTPVRMLARRVATFGGGLRCRHGFTCVRERESPPRSSGSWVAGAAPRCAAPPISTPWCSSRPGTSCAGATAASTTKRRRARCDSTPSISIAPR